MKTFLTICICAMVSAGIYGFVDMAGDIKHGTMIQYERGESQKPVTVAMLRKKYPKSETAISINAANFDLHDKIVNAEAPVVPEPSSFDFSLTDFTGKSFSRGDPGIYEDDIVFSSMPVPIFIPGDSASIANGQSAGTTIGTSSVVEAPVIAALETETVSPDAPLLAPVEIVDSLEVKQAVKVELEKIEWSSFSRGNPGKYKKPKKEKTVDAPE